jgi:ribosomal protein L29
MAESQMASVSQTNDREMTEQEYKALCKRLRQHQLKNRKKKAVPVLKPLGNTKTVQRNLLIAENPVDWQSLPSKATFSRDEGGHILYVKSGESRAINLNTMKSEPISGAAVYQVWL